MPALALQLGATGGAPPATTVESAHSRLSTTAVHIMMRYCMYTMDELVDRSCAALLPLFPNPHLSNCFSGSRVGSHDTTYHHRFAATCLPPPLQLPRRCHVSAFPIVFRPMLTWDLKAIMDKRNRWKKSARKQLKCMLRLLLVLVVREECASGRGSRNGVEPPWQWSAPCMCTQHPPDQWFYRMSPSVGVALSFS